MIDKLHASPTRLIVEQKEVEKKTDSGIILAVSEKQKQAPQIMQVVKAGIESKEKISEDYNIKDLKGLKVVIPKFAGVSIDVNEKEYKVIEYGDILAVIE
ncbi:MAG: co-chaperone GroES [Bacillota bacterium]